MPTAVTAHAVRAFHRSGRGGIPLRIPHIIPPGPSALTVKQRNAFIIPIINARRGMWTSRVAEHVTVRERHAQPLKRSKTATLQQCIIDTPDAYRLYTVFVYKRMNVIYNIYKLATCGQEHVRSFIVTCV